MALDTLIDAVTSVSLTQNIPQTLKISFTQRPTEEQYQGLLVDFRTFLKGQVDETIVATIKGRGLYVPITHFKRHSQPDYEGYLMQGAFSNAVEIRAFSPRDSQIMPAYADYLRQNLNLEPNRNP